MKLISQIICLLAVPLTAFATIWDPTPLDYKSRDYHQGRYYSDVTKTEKKFIVRLPKNYQEGLPVELVYFLAGGSGVATDMPEHFQDLGQYLNHPIFDNVLFVAPDANNYGLWADTPAMKNTQMVLELINYVEKNVPHKEGRKLIGHSLGGAGAMHFGFDHGKMFDGIVSISPAILMWSPFKVTDEQIREYIRDHAPKITFDYFKNTLTAIVQTFVKPEAWDRFDFYSRIKTTNLPKCFGIMTGGQDQLGFDFQAREFVAYAKNYGADIFYSEDSERNHSIGQSILEAAQFMARCK